MINLEKKYQQNHDTFKEAIFHRRGNCIYSSIFTAFITNFWLQSVIRLEFMQRLGDLMGHVDALTGQD